MYLIAAYALIVLALNVLLFVTQMTQFRWAMEVMVGVGLIVLPFWLGIATESWIRQPHMPDTPAPWRSLCQRLWRN